MLIDTHAHLNFISFNNDLPEVINDAKSAGIGKIIIPGAKLNSSEKAVQISSQFPSCFAAVGIHPHHIDEFNVKGEDAVFEHLTALSKQSKVVAIGECGLDNHAYYGSSPITEKIIKSQKELLRLQIQIASEIHLPLILHCRKVYDDMIEMISFLLKTIEIKGVFHCFGGEKKHLKKILDWGFYIGFDGNITYPENSNLREMVKYTPLDRLLIETDSPFLTPIPRLGERNSPVNLSIISSFISGIYKRRESDIADITSQNAIKLFNL